MPELVGDGYCHDYTNNLHCGFDLDDCCGSVCVNTEKCKDCKCKTGIIPGINWPCYTFFIPKNTSFLSALLIKIPGIKNALVGDGYCQDLTNTAECNFDGGDCCGSCKITTVYPAVYILGQ